MPVKTGCCGRPLGSLSFETKDPSVDPIRTKENQEGHKSGHDQRRGADSYPPGTQIVVRPGDGVNDPDSPRPTHEKTKRAISPGMDLGTIVCPMVAPLAPLRFS